jgi:photosystem II stability/assembly factor-like uncharacterized protein
MATTPKVMPCLALVFSSLMASATAARRNPTADQPKQKQSFRALQFDSIHMIDREVGWAQNASAVFETNDWVFNDKAIWRTTNGGRSWTQVLCASPAKTGNVSTFFRDSKTAWVAVSDESTNVAILRSTDGGGTWIPSQLRQSQIIQDSCLSFFGADQGWLMLIPAHAMNSSPGVLYRTRDGGAHWRKVNGTDASPRAWIWEEAALPEFAHRHPYLVCGGATAFGNDSVGWINGSLASTTPAYLFNTRDGGRSWQVQRLLLPASLPPGRMDPIGLPRFFQPDTNQGILPAEFHPADSLASNFCTLIYRTHDGGLNWQPTTLVKFCGVWSFITVKEGWIWSPEPHSTGSTAPVKGTLYHTGDGGFSWKPKGAEKGLERYLTHGEDVGQLDFVDGEYGWAIARDSHNLTQLLYTTDGGEKWYAIQTMMPP